jgi:dihydrofolate reductase
MRKLIVSEFVTLDGVMEDPGGAEGFSRGGWAFRFQRGPEGDRYKLDETLAAGALLLGRVTYEGFAAVWPSVTDDSGFAAKMNEMPKFVVSGSLDKADWNNSTVLAGDPATEVAELKRQPGGDILVTGSAMLVQALMEHGLVDEYRLMVYPIVLGSGKRLFGAADAAAPLRLVEARPVGEGIIILTYHPAAC